MFEVTYAMNRHFQGSVQVQRYCHRLVTNLNNKRMRELMETHLLFGQALLRSVVAPHCFKTVADTYYNCFRIYIIYSHSIYF